MKPATAFLILALAAGLSGCQTISPGLAVADTRLAPAAGPADISEGGEGADAEQHLGNLDDFYRDKLGIDPRILYAQRSDTNGGPVPMSQTAPAGARGGPRSL